MGSWMTQQLYIAMGSDRSYHTQAGWAAGAGDEEKGQKLPLFVSRAKLSPGAGVGVSGQ